VLRFVVIGLNHKSRLFELFFSALVLDFVNESGIENAYSLWHVSSGGDRKYALFEKAGDFGLTRILILNIILKEYSNIGVFTRSASIILRRDNG
jgi:hypothetical protein